MDLVHEQDFTLARSEPADKLVFLRDVFPRAIDGAVRPVLDALCPVSAGASR